MLTSLYEESKQTKESVSKFLTVKFLDDYLFCVQQPVRGQRTQTYLLDLANNHKRINLEYAVKIARWDFMSTLMPP